MTAQPSSWRPLAKLGLVALLCSLPFLATMVYLERKVEHVDTLPVDEYKALTWSPDGRSLWLLHRALQEGAATELWGIELAGSDFELLGTLDGEAEWDLTGHSVDGSTVLAFRRADGGHGLALVKEGTAQPLSVDPSWSRLPSQGPGLYFYRQVDDVPFDQIIDVEESPTSESGGASSLAPEVPRRMGIQIAQFDPSTNQPEMEFTIPFNTPSERPQVMLVRESLDQRFFALAIRFGEIGAAGLWVYDREASRLLWTRVMIDGEVHGMDWSADSVALALTDDKGLVLLDNVLSIESTRYEAQTLGTVRPLYLADESLYLVGEASVHRLDRLAGQVELVFDSLAEGLDVQNFTVSPAGGRAAFFASPRGGLELLVYDLAQRDSAPFQEVLPGSLRRQAQSTLAYQVGDALRNAWRFWRR